MPEARPRGSGKRARLPRFIVGACILAGTVRALVFCAALPLFNNVDEPSHYDMVLRYARGGRPSGLVRIGDGAARVIGGFASWEYMYPPPARATDATTPPWELKPARRKMIVRERAARWEMLANRESFEPPGYYAVAGRWARLGGMMGLTDARAGYWIRFLTPVFFLGVMLVAAGFAGEWYPESAFMRIGLPALVAFMPQDAFLAISNDAPVAWWGAAAFWLLTGFVQKGGAGIGACVLAGACLALMALTKYSALPVALAFLLLPVAGVVRPPRGTTRRRAAARAAIVAGIFAAMAGGWMVVTDGLGGMAAKASLLGWTSRPFAAWWDHPLFSLAGGAAFKAQLGGTFWRGEMVWHGAPLFPRVFDGVFLAATFLCFLSVLAGLVPASPRPGRRAIESVGFAAVCAAVLYQAWISVSFDFGTCFYPSRHFPFLASGRLALGALLPFCVLLLAGLERLGRWTGMRALPAVVLGCLIACMAGGELVALRSVAGSAYNWFHIP